MTWKLKHRLQSLRMWRILIHWWQLLRMYTRVYAKSALSPELGYSITGAIVRGVVDVPKPEIPVESLSGETPPLNAFLGIRQVYWEDGWQMADIYEMKSCCQGIAWMLFQLLSLQQPL